MSTQIAQRTIFKGARISLRSSATGNVVEGLAARFNSRSQDLGGFYEEILPGAFTRVLADRNLDCRFTLNHDPNYVLARTKSGTLSLQQTQDGLRMRASLGDQSYSKDLVESLSRGDISEMSFAFSVRDGDDEYTEDEDDDGNRCVLRKIRNFAELMDVAAVTYPAYKNTTVSTFPLADISGLTHPSNASYNSIPQSVLVEARSFAARRGIPVRPAHVPHVRMTDKQVQEAGYQERVNKWLNSNRHF